MRGIWSRADLFFFLAPDWDILYNVKLHYIHYALAKMSARAMCKEAAVPSINQS